MLKPSSKSLLLIRCSAAANGVFSFSSRTMPEQPGILCTVCRAECKVRVVGLIVARAPSSAKRSTSQQSFRRVWSCEVLPEDSRVHALGKTFAGEGARSTWQVLSPSLRRIRTACTLHINVQLQRRIYSGGIAISVCVVICRTLCREGLSLRRLCELPHV